MSTSAFPARHARSPRRPIRVGVVAGLAVVASLVLGSTATMTAAVTGQSLFLAAAPRAVEVQKTVEPTAPPTSVPPVPLPAPAESIPAPTVAAAPAVVDLCALPDVVAALAAGDDAATIAAAGGAEVFRSAVAGAMAPCVDLGDPGRVWTVINKTRPLDTGGLPPRRPCDAGGHAQHRGRVTAIGCRGSALRDGWGCVRRRRGGDRT